MKSRVSPIDITLIILVFIFYLTMPLLLHVFYRPLTKFDIQMFAAGYLVIFLAFVVDWYFTARKIFHTVEMDDDGIVERSVGGKVTKQYKWDEIKHVFFVHTPICFGSWICFTDEELTRKELIRVACSRKSIIYPRSDESIRFVDLWCDVPISEYQPRE